MNKFSQILSVFTHINVTIIILMACGTQIQIFGGKMEKVITNSNWLMNGACYRVGELEQSLLKAQAELELLREQRVQHVKMAEAIVKQRDTYRVLLAQATAVSLPPQGNRHEVKKIKLCGSLVF